MKSKVKASIRNIRVCMHLLSYPNTKHHLILRRLWGFSLFKGEAPSKESLRVEAARLRFLDVVWEHTRA